MMWFSSYNPKEQVDTVKVEITQIPFGFQIHVDSIQDKKK